MMEFEEGDYIKISGLKGDESAHNGLFLVSNYSDENGIVNYLDPVTGETMGVEFCDIEGHYRDITGE